MATDCNRVLYYTALHEAQPGPPKLCTTSIYLRRTHLNLHRSQEACTSGTNDLVMCGHILFSETIPPNSDIVT